MSQTPIVSVTEWRERLTAHRTTAAPPAPDVLTQLQRRFRDVTTFTRVLLQRPLEWPALQQLCEQALQLSQLALHELNLLITTGTGAADELAALLEHNWSLLQVIDGQRQLVEECRSLAEPFAAWMNTLARRSPDTKAAWQELVSSLDFLRPRAGVAWLPCAGINLTEALAREGLAHPERWAQAWLTGRLAFTTADNLLDADPFASELLALAGLLQDIGLWSLDQQPNLERGGSDLPRRWHPHIGAALLAGLPGCPSEVTLLVAEHHARPQTRTGTGGRSLSRRARLLTLLVRWAELLCDPWCHQEALARQRALTATIAERIWREIQHGWFAEELAVRLWEWMESKPTEQLPLSEGVARQQVFADQQHPLAPPHGRVSSRNFSSANRFPTSLRWRRARDSHLAERTVLRTPREVSR